MRARSALTALALAAALVGGCGGDDDAAPSSTTDGDTVSTEDAGVEVTGDLGAKPTIALPGGEPPAALVATDLAVGDGDEVPAGATVTTHYVGVSWSTGAEFDSSWDRGSPASFPLSGVIAGWTQGIPGMRVGGRRLLVIPADLAYGDSPPPSASIAPGETLVFVIDMVATQ